MRYKFRAFDTVHKEMVQPTANMVIDSRTGFAMWGFAYDPLMPQPDWEVMMWTGLHDKNGIPVYESDIVVSSDISGSGKPRVFQPRVVKWDEDSCEFNVSKPSGDRQLEVIGNIYQHPELINRR